MTFKEKKDLLETVRSIYTLEGEVKIYQNALIDLVEFDPIEAFPLANYVLVSHLLKLTDIRRYLLDLGNIDIFRLESIIESEDITISPPIIELSAIDNVPVIVDGIHRFWLARHFTQKIKAIYVQGVDASYPVISYPLNWSEVRVYEQKPEITRRLREGLTSRKKYYRDFSALGSLGTRSTR